MKPLIKLLPIYLFLFSSCQRQPTANFTTDKTEYQAGDTVHLKNNSEHGKHFIWTMPDGSTQTNTDATYIIPDTTLYSNFTFKLQALSGREKKSDEKSVTVLGMIRPIREMDSFSIGSSIYKNAGASYYNYYNYWTVGGSLQFGAGYGAGSNIYLSGQYQTSKSGVYTLQGNYTNLNGKQAYMTTGTRCYDCIPLGSQDHWYRPISGKIVMIITYTDSAKINAKVRIIYNDIEAFKDSTNTLVKISGNFKNYI